jgi:hypothetical protein
MLYVFVTWDNKSLRLLLRPVISFLHQVISHGRHFMVFPFLSQKLFLNNLNEYIYITWVLTSKAASAAPFPRFPGRHVSVIHA